MSPEEFINISLFVGPIFKDTNHLKSSNPKKSLLVPYSSITGIQLWICMI
jgi:hypothetical protein